MSENYIVINGKRAELTEEQLKQLGIEIKKPNPFERTRYGGMYFSIDADGTVFSRADLNGSFIDDLYDVANYCTDKAIMEQRALHETLHRLLWRYSMEHEGDKIDWSINGKFKYAIKWYEGKYEVTPGNVKLLGIIYFYSREIAEAAIKEIVEPFMKEHPEFKF